MNKLRFRELEDIQQVRALDVIRASHGSTLAQPYISQHRQKIINLLASLLGNKQVKIQNNNGYLTMEIKVIYSSQQLKLTMKQIVSQKPTLFAKWGSNTLALYRTLETLFTEVKYIKPFHLNDRPQQTIHLLSSAIQDGQVFTEFLWRTIMLDKCDATFLEKNFTWAMINGWKNIRLMNVPIFKEQTHLQLFHGINPEGHREFLPGSIYLFRWCQNINFCLDYINELLIAPLIEEANLIIEQWNGSYLYDANFWINNFQLNEDWLFDDQGNIIDTPHQ